MILHEIELQSANLAISEKFYQDVLGLKVFVSNDHLKVIESGREGLDLNVTDHRKEKISISFLVKDLQAMADKLKAQGISFTGPVKSHLGMEELIVNDPDGNRIALHEPTASSPDWLKGMMA